MSIIITTAYKVAISLPYGELKNIIEWCEKNCTSDWKFSSGSDVGDYSKSLDSSNRYNFYFESERDYVAFVVWKK